jgi:hypothetical protein
MSRTLNVAARMFWLLAGILSASAVPAQDYATHPEGEPTRTPARATAELCWSSWLDDVRSKHVSEWSAEVVLCLFYLLPLVQGVWLMIAAYRS